MTVDSQTLAEAQLQRQLKAERAGQFLSAQLATRFRKAARESRRRNALLKVTEDFKQKLEDKMLGLSLAAYLREYNLHKALVLSFVRPKNTYNLDLGNLKERFRTTTGRILRRNIEVLETRLNTAIRVINDQGLSEHESVKLLNARLKRMGLTTKEPNIAQIWIRTSLGIATGSARFDATQLDPGVWGYEYVTMRDDKVRPGHKKLDGYTRKKDDPIWYEIWPPNGWNCRCQVVPLREKQRQSRKKPNAASYVDADFIGVPLLLSE